MAAGTTGATETTGTGTDGGTGDTKPEGDGATQTTETPKETPDSKGESTDPGQYKAGVSKGKEKALKDLAKELGITEIDPAALKTALEEKAKAADAAKTLDERIATRDTENADLASKVASYTKMAEDVVKRDLKKLPEAAQKYVKSIAGDDALKQFEVISSSEFQELLGVKAKETGSPGGVAGGTGAGGTGSSVTLGKKLYDDVMANPGDRMKRNAFEQWSKKNPKLKNELHKEIHG